MCTGFWNGRRSIAVLASSLTVGWITTAGAEVVTTQSPTNWQAAVGGPTTTLGFADLGPIGAPIPFGTQYSALGVIATDGNDVAKWSFGTFSDEWGLFGKDINVPGGNHNISLSFAGPISGIGFKALTGFLLDLFLGADAVSLGITIGPFGPPNKFFGVTSTIEFDSAVLRPTTPAETVFIDDLLFESVPSPGGALLAILGLTLSTRRRRAN